MRLTGAAFALTVVAVGWWLLPGATDSVPGRPDDSLLNLWILNWDLRALASDPAGLLSPNAGALESRSLLRTETLLGIVPLYAVFRTLCAPVLAYNLTLLLSLALALASMALLVRHWTSSTVCGLLAGVAYALAPIHYFEAERIQLLQGCWLPLSVLAWERLPGRRGALVVGMLLAAQFLACVYLFFQVVWALGFWALADLRERPGPGPALRLAGALAVWAGALFPLLHGYAEMQQRWPDDRTLSVLAWYSGTPQDLLRTHPGNLLWGAWLGASTGRGLFPGLAVTVLAGLGLARGGPRRVPLLALAALAFVLTLGTNLQLAGFSPWLWLRDHLPGFAAQRVPCRYAHLFAFAVAGLAGLGLMSLRQRWALAWLALASLEALCRVSVSALPPVPAIYARLAALPAQKVVELPICPDIQPEPFPEARRLYFSLTHWKRLVNYYPMVASPLLFEFALFSHRGPDARFHDALLSADVNLVVVHRAELTAEEAALWKAATGFRLVAQEGDDQIWLVEPPSVWRRTPIGTARYTLEARGPVPAGQALTLGLRVQGQPGQLAYQPVPGMQPLLCRWEGPEDRREDRRALLPSWVFPDDDFTVQLPLRSPRRAGTYQLTLAGQGWSTQGEIKVDPDLTFGPVEQLEVSFPALAPVAPGTRLVLSVKLRNRGGMALRAGSLTHNPGTEVWLTRRWDEEPGLEPVPLRTDLYPGNQAELTMVLRAPLQPGVHQLRVGLEGGRELGSTPVVVEEP